MNRVPDWVVGLACCLAVAIGAEDREITGVELVPRLADESFPERERATAALWAMGDEVRGILEEAAESEVAEVSIRARDLLRKIELGILPDSPPAVVDLVLRYDRARPDERQRIVRELKELRAWKQVLKMYELERDPETLERLATEIAGVAVEAARELLVKDPPDLETAREMLEMGRAEPRELLALAEFHRVSGTLPQELARANQLEGRAGHLWRYALLATAGRVQEAADEADAAGEAMIAARLMVLAGDPVPWIEQMPIPQRELVPDGIHAYRRAVVDRWHGKPVADELVAELAAQVRDPIDDDSWASLGMLFALGATEEAEAQFVKLSPALSFRYFESMEEIEPALRAMGLDPLEPDYEGWCRKRFKTVIENPDESDEERLELGLLGSFLERRGLHEMLERCFVEALEVIGKKDPENFFELISQLYSGDADLGVVRPVLAAASDFAGDDEARWAAIRSTLFGEGSYVAALWDRLILEDPEGSDSDRLELMALLLGNLPDRDAKAAKWWDGAWAELEGAERVKRMDGLALLLALSAVTADGERYLKACDQVVELGVDLDQLSDEFNFKGYKLLCLGGAGRWDEVVAWWEAHLELDPDDPVRHAYLAGALRRAGEEEEAEVHEKVVARLALADVGTMRRIGHAYATVGDFDRASDWWWRAALQSSGTDGDDYFITYLIGNEAKERRDWKLAASVGEIQLLYLVMTGNSNESPASLIRSRIEVTMARAIARLDGHREESIEALRRCHEAAATDGSMADYFFPALRAAGLVREHDEWFEETWQSYLQVAERFPDSDNTLNTAAWTASRANRRLDEAKGFLTRALALKPGQAAYLDTMGEIEFARRDREAALEWSSKAIDKAPGEGTLLRQYERFRLGDFPEP